MRKLLYIYSIINKFLLILLHCSLPAKGVFYKYIREKIENYLFFSPRIRRKIPIQEDLLGKFQTKRLITQDCVKLHTWFIKPKNDMPIILYCHGQAENISEWQHVAIFLEKMGYGALFLSYRGHYKSAGTPSETGIFQDAKTAIEFIKRSGYSTKDIVVWGRSLGSTIPCEMATKYNLRGVILESAIFDIKSAAVSITNWYIDELNLPFLNKTIDKYINKINFSQKFANNEKIKNISCPIFIMHCKNDAKIHFHSAIGLHELNPNAELYLCEEGCHDKVEWGLEEVTKFLNKLTTTKDELIHEKVELNE